MPAIDYLKQKGHEIIFHQRINHLLVDNNQCIGAVSQDHTWQADRVILATSAQTTLKLIQAIPSLAEIHNRLLQIQYQPITTLYFQFPRPIPLSQPLIGLIGNTGQWIFDRTLCGNPTILSVIISGEGDHQKLSHAELAEQIIKEIQPYIPCHPIHYKIITEKQAAFSCTVNIQNLRPNQKTPLTNFYLAGDYTQTNYPATLEGAVLSGYKAALEIHYFKT
jgi:predicted NAD/FAD-dependent oxidoreductase